MKKALNLHDKDPQDASLTQLCSFVIAMKYPFEDLAEFIEDRSFETCDSGGFEKAVHQLRRVAEFFERLKKKNEENSRDLADVYMLIGEVHQCQEQFAQSIGWFTNAAVVNDQYAAPFHALALSYGRMGDYVNATKSLEQEISLAPGNYYSYLLLADLYEAQAHHDKAEAVLSRLLERDPVNIQALHRIITYYEKDHPELDVELLRRRIVAAAHVLNKVELVIWTYHMCRTGRYTVALQKLEGRVDDSPDVSIAHLLKAYIFGELHQYSRKRAELAAFKYKNDGNGAFIDSKLKEFGNIFGEKAVARLNKRLIISQAHHVPELTGGRPRNEAS